MIVTRPAGFYAEGEVETMLAGRAARCPTGAMADARDVAYAALVLPSDEARQPAPSSRSTAAPASGVAVYAKGFCTSRKSNLRNPASVVYSRRTSCCRSSAARWASGTRFPRTAGPRVTSW